MIVVTGASGQLGTAFRRLLGDQDVRYLDEEELDFRNFQAISQVIDEIGPSLVVNCAAYTAVDAAEENEDLARLVNATAVGELARATADNGAQFVTFSTDYVFDGTKPVGYVESDQTNPVSVYGATKLEGEGLARAAHPGSLVVRTSWLLSGTHANFASTMIKLISQGPVKVVDDQYGRPTLVDDLARVTLDAIDHGTTGIVHLANEGATTWFGLAREVAAIAGLDADRVTPCPTEEFPRPAPRPANSVLDSERVAGLGIEPMPPYRPGLERIVSNLLEHPLQP
jgi:dTDP-4-dehydrorhamnose reductase